MNIEQHLPYWQQGRRFANRFELNIVTGSNVDSWQHPDQQGPVSRPDGHEILRALEAKFLHRTIGLATLMHFQEHPDDRPVIFQGIHMCGWLDVIYGPCGGRLFVPTLTSQNRIHWMDLNSGFTCLDYVPLQRRV